MQYTITPLKFHMSRHISSLFPQVLFLNLGLSRLEKWWCLDVWSKLLIFLMYFNHKWSVLYKIWIGSSCLIQIHFNLDQPFQEYCISSSWPILQLVAQQGNKLSFSTKKHTHTLNMYQTMILHHLISNAVSCN